MALTLASNAITFTDSTSLSSGIITAAQLSAGAVQQSFASTSGSFGFRNKVINGNFCVAQRGTSFTSTGGGNNSGTYNYDRWFLLSQGNNVVNINTPLFTYPEITLTLTGDGVNKKFGIVQAIESINCLDMANKTATLSFKARVSDANTLSNIKAAIITKTHPLGYNADIIAKNLVSSWNDDNITPTLITDYTFENIPTNLNVTTGQATYTVTANLDTPGITNILVFIWCDGVNVKNISDKLYITDVQLELGSVATPFENRPISLERTLCQRYYYRISAAAPGPLKVFGTAYAQSASSGNSIGTFPTSLRIIPLQLEQSGTAGDYTISTGGTARVCSAVPSYNALTTQDTWVVNTTVASGQTAGQAGVFYGSIPLFGTAPYLGWSAEL